MYFLTDIDPNADVKGSRDPLGFQAIWTALGRRLVSNLTTVTSSLRGFSVLLWGLAVADDAVAGLDGSHEAREKERLAAFLRFEQLAAYSRYVWAKGSDRDIRGINRVKRWLDEGSVRISAADRHQILAEQRTYGLWGLYMNAARLSGLVEKDDARLTDTARRFVDDDYVKRVGPDGHRELVRRVKVDGKPFDPRAQDRQFAQALAKPLGASRSALETDVLGKTLVCGAGEQHKLWEIMVEHAKSKKKFAWFDSCTHADVAAYQRMAAQKHDDTLAKALEDVLALEPLLAVAETLFGHVVGRRQVDAGDVVRDLRRVWPDGSLNYIRADAVSRCRTIIEATGETKDDGTAIANRLSALLDALRGDDRAAALRHLLDQNDAVMNSRGGAGWMDRKKTVLRARIFQQPVTLAEAPALPALWRNSYFLDALRSLGADLYSLGAS